MPALATAQEAFLGKFGSALRTTLQPHSVPCAGGFERSQATGEAKV